jgi:CDP-Glycerol:Poly(glycerophosphate) glycerophosphotransferase
MDARSAGGRVKKVWLVLSDLFPTRVFVDCGIVSGLAERLPGQVEAILVLPDEEVAVWAERLGEVRWTNGADLFPAVVGPAERAFRRLDFALDRNLGYYPLSVRHSLRHGFNSERMEAGHPNVFLDSSQGQRLPRSERLDDTVRGWLFSKRRYVSSALVERMRADCSLVVLANVQSQPAVPFLLGARRLGLPTVGYVASWDHTVGKGIVSPHVTRYVVQNEVMRDDLVRYHDVDPQRVSVTGWPQTDVFRRRRPRNEYEAVLVDLGLDPGKPVVLVAGNTPTNAPHEGRFVRRLVDWWLSSGAAKRRQLLFRPHPRDVNWQERFAAALSVPGAAVQEPSYTDLETLATLLQHADCVVANAGTILLDSLVNDRPAVCVLYDEGATPEERYAELNVTGKHYAELVQSDAFLRATSFEEVVAGIDRALAMPAELAAERARVARDVVGEVDGRAAGRVVDAIVSTLP